MLVKIPYFEEWINPVSVIRIRTVGMPIPGLAIHFSGTDNSWCKFDTEDEAIVAAKDIAAFINGKSIYKGLSALKRQDTQENRDTTGEES